MNQNKPIYYDLSSIDIPQLETILNELNIEYTIINNNKSILIYSNDIHIAMPIKNEYQLSNNSIQPLSIEEIIDSDKLCRCC